MTQKSTTIDLAEWWDKAFPASTSLADNNALRWVAVPVPVLARLVTCARALIVLENIAGPIPFVRYTAREALVGITDTAQEPPHE